MVWFYFIYCFDQMDNKKSGIRLRHLQQPAEQPKKRDVSPNTANRKKIFDYNMKKFNDKPIVEDKKYKNEENNNSQYEQLVQNLKKKTMEIQLRDQAIKSLNKQIQDLKNQLRIKDKQIAKLNQQISFLQKSHINIQPQKDSHSFQPVKNQFASFSNLNVNNKTNHSFEAYDKDKSKDKRLQEQVSMSNLNYKNHFEQSIHQGEILSPFMALNNQRSFTSQITSKDKGQSYARKQPNTSRLQSQNQFNHYSTEHSGFNKKKQNREFNFGQQDQFGKKTTMIESVNKELQKFNIFGEGEERKQIFVRNQLQIEDSRQFKFEEFDKGFHDFNRY